MLEFTLGFFEHSRERFIANFNVVIQFFDEGVLSFEFDRDFFFGFDCSVSSCGCDSQTINDIFFAANELRVFGLKSMQFLGEMVFFSIDLRDFSDTFEIDFF